MRLNVFVLIFAALAGSTRAADGLAVSVACRSSHIDGKLREEPFVSRNRFAGKIIKTEVENDAVRSRDTIYKQTLAAFPTLSWDGKRVAFVRYPTLDDIYQEQGLFHLSVVKTDGSGLRDLVSFPFEALCKKFSSGNVIYKQGEYAMIDWPAGDWVYYYRFGGGSQATPKMEIRRVKYNDASTDEIVTTYSSMRNWSLSLDASKAAIRSNECTYRHKMFCVVPHQFPPPSHPDPTGLSDDCMGGCNSIISAGGEVYGHFNNGTHDFLSINEWEPGRCLSRHDVEVNKILIWESMANTDIHQSDRGNFDLPRWSVNSNKWFCGSIGRWRNVETTGANQVLVNWVDKKAIWTSSHTVYSDQDQSPDGMYDVTSAGDFFLYDISPGCYETVDGSLVSVAGGDCFTKAQKTIRLNQAHLHHKENNSVAVYSLTGKHVRTCSPAGYKEVIDRLPRGSYVVSRHGITAKIRVE